MAGTDSTKASAGGGCGPAIILVRPQLGENIGMAARAMLNCGLTRLRLVRPREPWPNDKALAASAGAEAVLDRARLFDAVEDAVADLALVYAATARGRDMTKEVIGPRAAANEMRALEDAGGRAGVLFGREAKGLANDDVALADAILHVPLNPAFASLNLAQAVFVVAYEWRCAGEGEPGPAVAMPKATRPATKRELIGFFEHLEGALDASGFLRIQEKRPIMVRNLRNMFQRAGLSEQEVRTLRGVISSLANRRKQKG